MRIAQIVTYLSADGAFGGPASVAIEQCRELATRGHDVSLFAGWDGNWQAADASFEYALFPTARPFGAARLTLLTSRSLLRDLHRRVRSYDVVHVHLGRDLITLPAARLTARKRPVVLQTHGMVMPDKRWVTRAIDHLVTRPTLKRATSVLYLTDRERYGVDEVAGRQAHIRYLPNGIADIGPRTRTMNDDASIVVFCARLHPRKRVGAFLEMAALLCRASSQFRFIVAGPDEGDLCLVEDFIRSHPTLPVSYIGALSGKEARQLITDAHLFVLPSRDEPFPMTVLESLALGTPAVVTDTCGIAERLHDLDAISVTDGSPQQLAKAVRQLANESTWRARSRRGQEAVRTHFSIAAVADELLSLYSHASSL